MSTLQFSLNDYITYIRMSDNKKLLVEGPDDNRTFNRLIDVFDSERKKVDVDDASQLINFDRIIGNREKVELVCNNVNRFSFSYKLVGFVDREFRNFSITTELNDLFRGHYIQDRLIWSRGHSIENYYFDYKTLREPFSILSTTPYYNEAYRLFEKNFEEIIRIACAVSLVGFEINNFGIIQSFMSWEIFSFEGDEIIVSAPSFLRIIDNKLEKKIANQITHRYNYWKKIVNAADFEIVRWICHGHVGLSTIWSAYKQAVYEVSRRNGCENPRREVEHALESREQIRFNACATKWIQRSLDKRDDIFPFDLLRMLDLVN